MEDDIEYVKKSTYRIRVMNYLKERIDIPSQIAKGTGIYQNHISNTLRQLSNRDLVVCINPEFRKGRLYQLTEKGEKVASHFDKSDEQSLRTLGNKRNGKTD